MKKQKAIELKEDICDSLDGQQKEYRVPYTKTVYGSATIMASSKKEAEERLAEHDLDDEWDNDSEYDFGEVEAA
jgi:hypothetical protein